MDYSEVSKAAVSRDFLRQRKYEQIKNVTEWICTWNEMTQSSSEKVSDLAGKLSSMVLWNKITSDELTPEVVNFFKVEGPYPRHHSDELSSASSNTGASPASMISSWLGNKSVDDSTSDTQLHEGSIDYSKPGHRAYQRRCDELVHGRHSYGASVESIGRSVASIDKRMTTMTSHFKQRFVSIIEKFNKDLELVCAAAEAFKRGAIASNQRRTEADIAVRGPTDVRITILFEELAVDSAPEVKTLGCAWHYHKPLAQHALAFAASCEALWRSFEQTLTESYSIYMWSKNEKQRLFDQLLENHRRYSKFCYDVEMAFSKQFASGDFSDNLVAPPRYEVPTIIDSIKVSFSTMTAHCDEVRGEYPIFATLKRLSEMPCPMMDQLGVATTIVQNKMAGFWSKDDPPIEIDLDQLVIVQLTWDRYMHVYRSHDDLKPLKSLYVLEMEPIVKKSEGEIPEIIELRPVITSSLAMFTNVFKRPNASTTPFLFSFTSEDDAKLWKRLIRYGSIEQDVAFLTFAKLVSEKQSVAIQIEERATERKERLNSMKSAGLPELEIEDDSPNGTSAPNVSAQLDVETDRLPDLPSVEVQKSDQDLEPQAQKSDQELEPKAQKSDQDLEPQAQKADQELEPQAQKSDQKLEPQAQKSDQDLEPQAQKSDQELNPQADQELEPQAQKSDQECGGLASDTESPKEDGVTEPERAVESPAAVPGFLVGEAGHVAMKDDAECVDQNWNKRLNDVTDDHSLAKA